MRSGAKHYRRTTDAPLPDNRPSIVDPRRERMWAFDLFTTAEIVIAMRLFPGFELPVGCHDRKNRMERAKAALEGGVGWSNVTTPAVESALKPFDLVELPLEQREGDVHGGELAHDVVGAGEPATEKSLLGEVDPAIHRTDLAAGGGPLPLRRVMEVVHEGTVAGTERRRRRVG